MRRIILLVLLLLVFTGVSAQGVIRETRNAFNTFGSKITKVVIPSNSLPDLMLRDAVSRGWRISPFEFCTMEEYQALQNDTNYFFLLRVDGRYKRDLEPKIEYLTLVKGGPEVRRGLYSSHNIITLPFQESEDMSGVNLHLIPILIDVIQNHIYKVQQDVLVAFKGTSVYSDRVSQVTDKRLLFPKEYLNFEISDSEFSELFAGKVKIVSADDVEEAIINNTPNTVVPVLIRPRGDSDRSFCYKMLIGTDTHELLFFRRHRVSSRMPVGFNREDIRKISIPFQF